MQTKELLIRGIETQFEDTAVTLYKITAQADGGKAVIPADLWHSHFYYECHLLIPAGTPPETGGEAHRPEGKLIIIPPHTEHYPLRFEDADDIVLGITLQQNGTDGRYTAYFLTTLAKIAQSPLYLPPVLTETLILFYRRFDSNRFRDRCYCRAAAHEIVFRLFDCANGFSLPEVRKEQNPALLPVAFNLEHLINDTSRSLSEIASILGYSPRHTARLIREKYGKNLGEIRKTSRIATAKKLLAGSENISLETAAIRAGFPSADAMARAFRKAGEAPPSQYRKKEKT